MCTLEHVEHAGVVGRRKKDLYEEVQQLLESHVLELYWMGRILMIIHIQTWLLFSTLPWKQ